MAFTGEVIWNAFQRAGERCECTRSRCNHPGNPHRCSRQFRYEDRARSDEHGWQATHKQSISSGGSDGLENCEILCVPCHKNTLSYGRS